MLSLPKRTVLCFGSIAGKRLMHFDSPGLREEDDFSSFEPAVTYLPSTVPPHFEMYEPTVCPSLPSAFAASMTNFVESAFPLARGSRFPPTGKQRQLHSHLLVTSGRPLDPGIGIPQDRCKVQIQFPFRKYSGRRAYRPVQLYWSW